MNELQALMKGKNNNNNQKNKEKQQQRWQNPAILLTNQSPLCYICCLYYMYVGVLRTVVTAVQKWRRVSCYNYFGKQIKIKSIKWKKGTLMDCISHNKKVVKIWKYSCLLNPAPVSYVLDKTEKKLLGLMQK